MSNPEDRPATIAIGDTFSRYRIAALLGEGGMGVVYRARDERLKRDVAIKILAPGRLTDEMARRRFRNEALALSRLNHPNIQIVHDFDSDRGVDFLVTEYVAGMTLRERLMSRPLSAREVCDLGIQLAEGLTAAHARGIVHRDLKPENLKVTTEGLLKILDFGIAQSIARATDTIATTDAIEPKVIGTLPYMAPEQIRGDAIDARTDIFAAGCVLFEMSTGRRAFPEESSSLLIDSILNRTPEIDRRVPAGLRRIILKCLQRKPQDRYQSAAELANDLRRAAGGRVVAWPWLASAAIVSILIVAAVLTVRFLPNGRRVHSIAVLPLQNLSGDPQQEYFADGMTDALITDLGRLGVERVIARGSMMRYKKTTKSLPEIARELNVDTLVSGAVMREGNRVRVTAEMIDPATQTQLWSDRYEANLADILRLQGDLASTIATRIRNKLSRNKTAPHRVSGEAFDAYLKAMAHKYKATPQDVSLRMQYLQLAVQKDPSFAQAHAEIAGTWAARIVYQMSPPREAVVPAKAEALRALELDPDLADAHLAMAIVKQYMEWDWNGAEQEYRRALDLDPGSPDVHFQYATLLGPGLGRFDDWKTEIDRCIELDPLSPFYRYFRGRHLMTMRKPNESIAALQKVLHDAPDFAQIHDGLWYAYETTHQYDLALVEAEKSFERKGDREVVTVLRDSGGDYKLAMNLVAAILEKRSAHAYVPSAVIARMYVYGDDREKAIARLQQAYETHDSGMVTLKNAPSWDPLRGDPRFQELVRRLKFPA